MEFLIKRLDKLDVSDEEIFDLLSEVYVQAGFTNLETAKVVFKPSEVKKRGVLFGLKETSLNEFAGMVIVVPPGASAVVRAKENECEMHLLGVLPKFRGYGLGRKLVEKALAFASENGWTTMILWTQKSMKEAQSLYESSGFTRCGEMNKNGIEFLVYERNCS